METFGMFPRGRDRENLTWKHLVPARAKRRPFRECFHAAGAEGDVETFAALGPCATRGNKRRNFRQMFPRVRGSGNVSTGRVRCAVLLKCFHGVLADPPARMFPRSPFSRNVSTGAAWWERGNISQPGTRRNIFPICDTGKHLEITQSATRGN